MIVDDHAIVRHGLAQLIGQEDDLIVCAEASGVAEAEAVFEKARPDVVVVDITMKDGSGLDVIRAWRARGAKQPMLVLSMHDESIYGERALRAGANGYVMKEQAEETIVEALRKVLKGGAYVSPRMSDLLVKQLIGETGGGREASPTVEDRLTEREREVFACIGRGLSTQRIAEQLDLSMRTVEVHRSRIRQKLGLGDSAQLAREAILWVEGRK